MLDVTNYHGANLDRKTIEKRCKHRRDNVNAPQTSFRTESVHDCNILDEQRHHQFVCRADAIRARISRLSDRVTGYNSI